MIQFDRTRDSVVALCACGWRALAGDLPGADSLAMDHIYRAHPAPDLDRERFLDARLKRQIRSGDTR